MILLLGSAFAWNHIGQMWSPDEMPITWYMTDYVEGSLPAEPSPETGLLYQEEASIIMFCNWHWTDYCDSVVSPTAWGFDHPETADCADITYEYLGISPGNEGQSSNGITKFYWDDPSGELGTGINAVTYPRSKSEVVKTQNGRTYYKMYDADIVFNRDINWSPDADIETSCAGEMSVEATGTHEVGHLLGMAHSCEQGEPCNADDLLKATMYWSGGQCETSRSAINEDDIEGINALYGPNVEWTYTGERFGAVPLEICFELLSDEETLDQITSVEWRFGDGETSPADAPCHTYNSQGQFNLTLTVQGEGESCGGWQSKSNSRAFALVCDAPAPEFQVEHFDGLIYQLVNITDVSTYGCVDGVLWEIYEGSSDSGTPVLTVGAWSPKVDFSDLGEGTYTVVLTAQGPASEGEQAKATVEVVDAKGAFRGCGTTGAAGLGAALFMMGAIRRRRA